MAITPEPQPPRFFDGLSAVSHYLRMYYRDTLLANATCFFAMSSDGPVLLTNRHNFTGRNNITGEPLHKDCGIPDNAVVTFHTAQGEVHYHVDLVDHESPGAPSWTEHPTLGAAADIVAVPVREMGNIVSAETSVNFGDDWYRWNVGSEVHVIGFPYGQVGGPFPIWSKGFIASEPDVDIAGLPMFLIDCRSRPGQSGSPVYARFRKGEIVDHAGKEWQAKQPVNYFVGIYSGRLRSDSDLGFVWKRRCIEELVEHAVARGTQHRMELRRHSFAAAASEQYSLERLISDVDGAL